MKTGGNVKGSGKYGKQLRNHQRADLVKGYCQWYDFQYNILIMLPFSTLVLSSIPPFVFLVAYLLLDFRTALVLLVGSTLAVFVLRSRLRMADLVAMLIPSAATLCFAVAAWIFDYQFMIKIKTNVLFYGLSTFFLLVHLTERYYRVKTELPVKSWMWAIYFLILALLIEVV